MYIAYIYINISRTTKSQWSHLFRNGFSTRIKNCSFTRETLFWGHCHQAPATSLVSHASRVCVEGFATHTNLGYFKDSSPCCVLTHTFVNELHGVGVHKKTLIYMRKPTQKERPTTLNPTLKHIYRHTPGHANVLVGLERLADWHLLASWRDHEHLRNLWSSNHNKRYWCMFRERQPSNATRGSRGS